MGEKNRVGVLSTPTLAGLFLPVVPVAHTGESVDLGIAGGHIFPVVTNSDVSVLWSTGMITTATSSPSAVWKNPLSIPLGRVPEAFGAFGAVAIMFTCSLSWSGEPTRECCSLDHLLVWGLATFLSTLPLG